MPWRTIDRLTDWSYQRLAKPMLFRLDPERAHEVVISSLSSKMTTHILRLLAPKPDPRLELEIAGLRLINPFGVAAGVDKDCRAVESLGAMGFGLVEAGTVTLLPQPGNPRPRIFRYPEAKAVINRVGFPSCGAEEFKKRAQLIFNRSEQRQYALGINLGKNKETSLEEAPQEYHSLASQMCDVADFLVINVSSPNTPNLRALQDRKPLEEIVRSVRQANRTAIPIFLKISPDLTEGQLNDVAEVAVNEQISGIIATNSTLSRTEFNPPVEQQGGVSGAPIYERSLKVVRDLAKLVQGRLPIIGLGGISSTEQVIAYLQAGASSVQMYTGLIYGGPALLSQLHFGLLDWMDRHGVNSLAEIKLH